MKYIFFSMIFLMALQVNANEAAKVVNNFFGALVSGDVNQLEVHYSDDILLRKGSEFLKPNWGIPNADRSKDCKVAKKDLMKAYKAAFAKIGKQKWQGIFAKLPKNSIQFQQLGNQNLKLTIVVSRTDQFEFEFAKNRDGQYKVVSEYTDY